MYIYVRNSRSTQESLYCIPLLATNFRLRGYLAWAAYYACWIAIRHTILAGPLAGEGRHWHVLCSPFDRYLLKLRGAALAHWRHTTLVMASRCFELCLWYVSSGLLVWLFVCVCLCLFRFSVVLYVRLLACLACLLLACLFVCLFVCLSVCLFVCLF